MVCGVLAVLAGCASPQGDQRPQPTAEQQRYLELWASYRRDDPEWPDRREEWLQDGEVAEGYLVQLLLKDVLEGTDHATWQRAQGELKYVRSAAIDYGLSLLDVATDRERRDPIVLDRLGYLFASLGAVEEMRAELDAEHWGVSARRVMVSALANMESDEAFDEMLSRLETAKDWEVRGDLVEALEARLRRPDRSREVAALLLAVNADDDTFVRGRAAWALRDVRNSPDVADGLVAALERSLRGESLGELTAVYRALKANSGRDDLEAKDLRDWRAWAEEVRAKAEGGAS